MMPVLRRWSMLALLPCAVSASTTSGQTPIFRAEARLVVLQVAVHGSRGERVADLNQAAFTVYENGKPQPISIFLGDNVPVSVGMVLDNSGSMRTRRSRVEAAARAFTRASNPLDEVFVINFADKARIDVPLGSDLARLEAGIARLDPIGGTALRDALDRAETYLNEHAIRERKVLLVVTDGYDNASTVSASHVQKQAEQNEIAVYAIGLPHADPDKVGRARRELDDLTNGTGGLAIHLSNIDEVEAAAIDLARRIRQQYTLAYAPVNQALDGSYRRIRVVVKGHQHMSARTRAGYLAERRETR